jgi:flagellar motor switch protein FliM
MEPLLAFEEISSLRDKARRRTSALRGGGDAASLARFDPGRSAQLSAGQALGLEAFHRNCARRIGASLSALLQARVELDPSAVEPVSSAGFLEGLPDPTYLATFRTSVGGRALLQVDLSLAFPWLDRLLGGAGHGSGETRDLTDIEGEVFETVSRLAGRELQAVWQPFLEADWDFEQWRSRSQVAALTAPNERMLVLSFQGRFGESQGRCRLALPSALSTALLPKLLPSSPSAEPSLPPDSMRLCGPLLESRFSAELRLPPSPLSLRQVYALEPGHVVILRVPSDEPLQVHVAGRLMFLASPVCCGALRGAQLQTVLSIAPKEREEARVRP